MRKLSKKISMLMVLAMLVSLFSGVVSASAASSWSFYNKTTGEDAIVAQQKDVTYKMEKGVFADFDLYKDGEVVDTDTYTVKYESDDEDVVWVDAKNGKLRADKFEVAEVGDIAKITAVITNKESKVVARRWFNIEIVASEPKYGIEVNFGEEAFVAGEEYVLEGVITADGEETEDVVTFYIDGKELADGKYVPEEVAELVTIVAVVENFDPYEIECTVVAPEGPEFADAKQTALNAVEITVGNAYWAKKALTKIEVAKEVGNLEIAELVKNVEIKKDTKDVVVVTLHNNIAADATYNFTFADTDAAASIVGYKTTPTSIAFVETVVPANKATQADIKAYNAEGIDVTAVINKNVTYTLVGENNDCDVQADGAVYFFEKGKQAVVKAVLDMGYDKDGNEITDIETQATFDSVDEFTYSGIKGYALSDGSKANKDLTYGNDTLKLSLSDKGKKIIATYDKIPYKGDKVAEYVAGGQNDEKEEYKYYSTNESIVLVNEATGELHPCKDGYANIYMKKGDAYAGSVNVQIQAARKLDTFTASMANSDSKLATALGLDSVKIDVATKDQYTAEYKGEDKLAYEVKLDTKDASGNLLKLEDYLSVSVAGDQKSITLTLVSGAAAKIENDKVQTLALTVTAKDLKNANNNKAQKLTVFVRDNAAYTGNKVSTLTVSAKEVDLALNKKEFKDYATTIKLVNIDDKSYDLGLENIAFEAAATTGSAYSVVITKVGDSTFDATKESKFISITGSVITINPVAEDGSKLATGTYKVQLYKRNDDKTKMQAVKSDNIVIKDTAPTVTAKATTSTIAAGKGLADVLEISINGAKVEAKHIVNVAPVNQVEVNGKMYVGKVKVTFSTTALNKDSKLNLTFDKEVAVDQLFTVE